MSPRATTKARPGDLVRRNAGGRLWKVIRIERGRLVAHPDGQPGRIAWLSPARFHVVPSQKEE